MLPVPREGPLWVEPGSPIAYQGTAAIGVLSRRCGGAGLYGENSAVDVDFRTGDVGRFIGSQEQNGVGYLVDFSRPAHRDYAHTFGPDGGVGSTKAPSLLAIFGSRRGRRVSSEMR